MSSQVLVDSFADANKNHYNNIAHEYDELPYSVERPRRTAAAMIEAYDFDENTTTVMEYACGTGLVSRELAPYTKRILGVDISQAMVDQFNKRVENQGIPPEEMQAVCVELKGEPGELDDERFDVIVCASSYHHFTSIENVTQTLVYFLKPGGTLLVVDLMKSDRENDDGSHGHGHGHHHGHSGHGNPKDTRHYVAHRNGFDEDDLRRAFQGAGLDSFSFQPAIGAKQRGQDCHLFLAKGLKPSTNA